MSHLLDALSAYEIIVTIVVVVVVVVVVFYWQKCGQKDEASRTHCCQKPNKHLANT